MCKSGKSLLRWLTFKHAHQSTGHLTHLWDQVWLAENLRVSSSVSRWWCPCLDPPDHISQNTLCSHVSSYVQAVTACQYPLVMWNYCKRKETPWWLRALSSTHDWHWAASYKDPNWTQPASDREIIWKWFTIKDDRGIDDTNKKLMDLHDWAPVSGLFLSENRTQDFLCRPLSLTPVNHALWQKSIKYNKEPGSRPQQAHVCWVISVVMIWGSYSHL